MLRSNSMPNSFHLKWHLKAFFHYGWSQIGDGMVVDWLDWLRVIHKIRPHFSWYLWHPPSPCQHFLCLTIRHQFFLKFWPLPPKKCWRTLWTTPNVSTKSFGAFDKVKCVFINPVDCCLLPKSLTRWGIFEYWGPCLGSVWIFFFIFCKWNQINCSHYNKYSWIILCFL